MLIQSFSDVIVLAIVAAVLFFIIRGLRRGTVKTCNCGCGGSCKGCATSRSNARVRLSHKQRKELKFLRNSPRSAA